MSQRTCVCRFQSLQSKTSKVAIVVAAILFCFPRMWIRQCVRRNLVCRRSAINGDLPTTSSLTCAHLVGHHVFFLYVRRFASIAVSSAPVITLFQSNLRWTIKKIRGGVSFSHTDLTTATDRVDYTDPTCGRPLQIWPIYKCVLRVRARISGIERYSAYSRTW